MFTGLLPINIQKSLGLTTAALISATLLVNQANAVQTKNCPTQIEISVGGFESEAGYIRESDKDHSTLTKFVNLLGSSPKLEFTESLTLQKRGRGSCVYSSNDSGSNFIRSTVRAEVFTKNGDDSFRLDVWVLKPNADDLRSYLGVSVYAGVTGLSPQNGITLNETKYYSLFAYFWGRPSDYYDGGFERRRIGKTHQLRVH